MTAELELACAALKVVLTGLFILLALVVIDGLHLRALWQLRHIPGPLPLPFVGNTLEVYKHDLFLYKAWQEWGRRYGRVFKWFWGPQPVICVRDAELVRQICVRHFKSFPDRSMFYPPQDPTVNKVFAQGITFSKGSYWLGLRGALQPMFHSSGIASYQPCIAAASTALCERLAPAADAGGSVNMHAALCGVALESIAEAAFGVPLKGAATCESAANSSPSEQADCGAAEAALVGAANYALENTAVALTYMLVPPLLKPVVWRLLAAAPPPRMRELNAARRKLFGAAETLAANAVRRLGLVWEDDIGMAAAFDTPDARPVRERYADVVPAAGSVVDLLVRAKDRTTGAPLRASQIVAQANSILVAGHDTTSFCLTSTLYWVSRTPAVKAKLFAEIDRFGRDRVVKHDDMSSFPYLDAVLSESLRLSPPGWMTSREVAESITLCGVHFPRGAVVYIDIHGIQRDARYWEDPDAFKPERFLDRSPAAQERNQLAWLAFGVGPRTCIGYKFALSEAKTLLVSLWQRYDFELDTLRTPEPPVLRPGITLGYRHGLWCRVSHRS